MNDIKESLTRKLGPLPVWAWALIAGVGIYIYRTRHGLGSVNVPASTTTDASSPAASDAGSGGGSSAPPSDPVTLQPGESVYDPLTGHLIGTAPEQQTPDNPIGTPMDPVTIEPGEQVYDPNTGKLFGGTPPTTKRNKKPPGKRKPKPKPHHKPRKGIPKPGGHKSRRRSAAKLLTPVRRKKASNPPKGRTRGKGNPAVPAPRVRAHTKTTPVIRQHPASNTAPRPTPHPLPRSTRGPARRRRK